MKKILFIALAIIAFGFVGCVEDNPFMGFNSVTQSPGSVTPEDAVTVTANTTGVKSAELIYTVDNGTPQTVDMTLVSDGGGTFIGAVFTGVIPAQADDAKVVYYVVGKGEGGTVRSDNKEYTVSMIVIDYTVLVLNEINGVQKFIEIYNKGTEAIDLKGVSVERNEGQSAYTQETSLMLPAGGFAVVKANSFAPVPEPPVSALILGELGSGLSAAQALRVTLKEPGGNIIDSFVRRIGDDAWGATAGYDNVGAYTRYPNGTGGWFAYPTGSCGATNLETSTVIPNLVP